MARAHPRATANASDDLDMVGVGILGMRARVGQLKGKLFVKDCDCGLGVIAMIPYGAARSSRRAGHRSTVTAKAV